MRWRRYPLTLPGVKQVIIWGDEHSNATKEAELVRWFKANEAVFEAPDAREEVPERASTINLDAIVRKGDDTVVRTQQRHLPRALGGARGAARRPPAQPIPRDGPIPPYTSCTL